MAEGESDRPLDAPMMHAHTHAHPSTHTTSIDGAGITGDTGDTGERTLDGASGGGAAAGTDAAVHSVIAAEDANSASTPSVLETEGAVGQAPLENDASATDLRRESIESRGEMMSISLVEFQRFQMELVELKAAKYEWGEQQRWLTEELRRKDDDLKKKTEELKRREDETKKRDEDAKKRDEDAKKRDEDAKKRDQRRDEDLKKKDDELKKKDDELKKKADDVKRRDEEIKRRDEEMKKRDEEIKKLKKDVQQVQKDDGKGGGAQKARLDTLLRDYRQLEAEFTSAKATHAEEKGQLRQALKTLGSENDDLKARLSAAESAASLIFAASADDEVGPHTPTRSSPSADGREGGDRGDCGDRMQRTESGFESVALLATPTPTLPATSALAAVAPGPAPPLPSVAETEPSTHGSPDGSVSEVPASQLCDARGRAADEAAAKEEGILVARERQRADEAVACLSGEKRRADEAVAALADALSRLDAARQELEAAVAARDAAAAARASLAEDAADGRVAVEALRSQLSATSTEAALLKADLNSVREELRVRDDELANLNIRLKWTQNKLQAEQEALAHMKAALDKATKRANELREECDGVRANYATVVEALQGTDQTHRDALEALRRETEAASKQQARELADQQDLSALRAKEVDEWRTRHAELLLRHDSTLKDMDAERKSHADARGALADAVAKLNGLQEAMEALQKEAAELRSQADTRHALAEESRALRRELEAARIDASNTAAAEYDARSTLAEVLAEKTHATEAVASLEVRVHALEKQKAAADAEAKRLATELRDAAAKLRAAEYAATALQSELEGQLADAARNLATSVEACERLRADYDHECEQRKISERKSQMALKDLQRQLKQERNRVVELETGLRSPLGSTGSMHSSSFGAFSTDADAANSAYGTSISANGALSSRLGHSRSASDGNSADAASVTAGVSGVSGASGAGPHPLAYPPPRRKGSMLAHGSYADGGLASSSDHVDSAAAQFAMRRGSTDAGNAGGSWETLPVSTGDAAETKALSRRLAQLQKDVKKRDERIKFFEEHTTTLVDDIRRKSKVIQEYAMRDEAGVLAPPMSDAHKMQRSRDRGIMASLFSQRPHDSRMTLELSLEISSKLQSLLEDALLKNMQLQENIDTLGNEIARLQKPSSPSPSQANARTVGSPGAQQSQSQLVT